MVEGEYWNGRWGVMGNLLYSDLSDTRTGPLSVSADVSMTIIGAAAAYRFGPFEGASNRSVFDTYVGLRYSALDVELEPAVGPSASRRLDFSDPVIGGRFISEIGPTSRMQVCPELALRHTRCATRPSHGQCRPDSPVFGNWPGTSVLVRRRCNASTRITTQIINRTPSRLPRQVDGNCEIAQLRRDFYVASFEQNKGKTRNEGETNGAELSSGGRGREFESRHSDQISFTFSALESSGAGFAHGVLWIARLAVPLLCDQRQTCSWSIRQRYALGGATKPN